MKISIKLIYFFNLWLDSHQIQHSYTSRTIQIVDYVFGDLDPIFKVIVLYVGYLLNQWLHFSQTYMDVPLAQA